MINFSDGSNSRLSSATRDPLFNGNGWRQPIHQVNIRFFQLFDELAGIWRHAVEESALAFGKKNVECERRFPRTAKTGDHHHLIAWNTDIDVLQVMLAGAVDLNGAIS